MDRGERLGLVGQTDLLICKDTGKIEALLYRPASFLGLGKKGQESFSIPWQAVCKIGPEMIIVQLKGQKAEQGL